MGAVSRKCPPVASSRASAGPSRPCAMLSAQALAWIPLVLRQLLHSGLLVLQVAPGACLVFPARSLHAAAVGASSLAAVAASMAPRAPSTDEEQRSQRQELGALRAFAILQVLAPLLFIGLTVLAGSIAHQIVLFGILLASSTAAFVKVCAAHSRCRLIAVTDEAEDDDADDASRSRAARAVVALATFLPMVLGFATGAMLVALATATDGCPASFGTFGEVIASGQDFPTGFSGSAGQARLWDAVAMSTALNAFGAVSFICCATLVMLRTVHAVARDRRAIATATAESLQSALRVMSHETRGPTNAAVLALALLDAALADERVHEARELLRDLRISLNRTKQGLDSLLALQSADAASAANDVNWAWGPAHVDALITVRSAMRGACEAEGVGLELAFAEPGDCERKTPALLDASLAGWEVFVDADKVAAICTNFVSNALKHAPEVSPMVRVCASIVQTDEGWPVAEVQTLARAKSSVRLTDHPSSEAPPPVDSVPALSARSDARPSQADPQQPQDSVPQRFVVRVQRVPQGSHESRQEQLSARARLRRHDSREMFGHLTEEDTATALSTAHVGMSEVAKASLVPLVSPARPTALPPNLPPTQPGGPASARRAPAARGRITPATDLTAGRALEEGQLRYAPAAAAAAAGKVPPAGPRPSAGAGGRGASARFEADQAGESASSTLAQVPTSGPRRCMLLLEVLDNGEGMSTEDLTSGKLFAPFARLRQGDGRLRMASTGLGLSIVKSLAVRDMGGAVGVSSRHGDGACFFAMIPCWGRTVDMPAASRLTPRPPTTSGAPALAALPQASAVTVTRIQAATAFGGASLTTSSAGRSADHVALAASTAVGSADDAAAPGPSLTSPQAPRHHQPAAAAKPARSPLSLVDATGLSSPSPEPPAGHGLRLRVASQPMALVQPAGHAAAAAVAGAGARKRPLSRLQLGCGSGSSSPDATVPANEDDPPPSRSRHRRAVTVSHSRRSSTASEARSREARAFRRSQRNVQRQSRRGSFPSGHSVGDSQRALPGLDEEAAGSAADSLDPAPPHCIIVDDDSLTRQLTARLVRSWGFTVDELQDGTELVEHLRQLVSTAGRSSTSHPATPLAVGGTQLASERQRNSGLPTAESGAASALTLRGDSSGTLHIAVTSPKAQPGHRPGRSFDWESGSVATTVARPKLPVLVCLDSNMPKMDGPDALVELRRIFTAAGDGMTALFEGITVVGITGHSAAADHQVFLDAGAKAVLTKPVDPDRLLAIAAPLKA